MLDFVDFCSIAIIFVNACAIVLHYHETVNYPFQILAVHVVIAALVLSSVYGTPEFQKAMLKVLKALMTCNLSNYWYYIIIHFSTHHAQRNFTFRRVLAIFVFFAIILHAIQVYIESLLPSSNL